MERPPAPAPGMSLRDWFAGRAMGALLGDSRMMVMFDKISRGDPKGSVANVAYGLADAMLAEREKGGDA